MDQDKKYLQKADEWQNFGEKWQIFTSTALIYTVDMEPKTVTKIWDKGTFLRDASKLL